MLRSISELQDYKIHARNGDIGKVSDFYFDDQSWKVRYLIADTGNWLVSRLVLISPESLGTPDFQNEIFPVNLTKQQIENSPSVETDQPVSRQKEVELSAYYGWTGYWLGAGPVLPGITPVIPADEELSSVAKHRRTDQEVERGDPNLRSAKDVIGYSIQANDDKIGEVDDFIVEDGTWNIRYVIVDTGKWLLPGKKVIIALPWIKDISWEESKVFVDLDKDALDRSPEYNPSELINQDFEERLYTHYGKTRTQL